MIDGQLLICVLGTYVRGQTRNLTKRSPMEQYDDTFEAAEAAPPIKDIEKRLRKLGCTKEQVRRHIEHVTKSRTEPVSKTRGKNRPHVLDWP